MKFLFTAFIFLCVENLVIAQHSQVDGWVELNNGDTLFGKITEKDWNSNPVVINFVKENNVTYSVSQLNSFGTVNGDIYRRYIVIRHLVPNRETDLFPEDENKQDTVTLWLKIIVQAGRSLGALYQTNRSYFYFIDNTGATTELQCSNGIKNFNNEKYRFDSRYNKTFLVENDYYRSQLNELFPDKTNMYDARSVEYTEASLGRLFRKLNNVTQSTSVKGSFYMGLSAGASYFESTIGSTYPAYYYAGAKLKGATQPFVRVSFNFQKARKRNRISLAPELGLSLFNTTGTKPDVSRNNLAGYEIKNLFLEAGITTRVFLNPAAKQKIFIGAGINTLLRIKGKNKYDQYDPAGNVVITSTEPEQPSVIVAPSLSLGYTFSSFAAFANYQHFSNLLTHVGSKWTVNRYSIGISCYFMN